jgi:hypothetical protein
MISPGQSDSVWIPDFIGKKQAHSFNWVIASINIISQKEVICKRRFAADSKEFDQVMKLAVYIAADCYRGLDKLSVGLIAENLLGFLND